MNPTDTQSRHRTILATATFIWLATVLYPSLHIWFDWETVRFFVISRPDQYRWLAPWYTGWIDLSDYGISAASLTLRPLMSWSFQLESILFKSWAPGYHLLNIFAHLSCTGLLIRFLHRQKIGLYSAWLAGLLFAVHPLSTQPLWILGDRAEVFVLLGGLIALNTYRTNPFLSSAGLVLALLSKETAVTIPAWLIAAEFCLSPNRKSSPDNWTKRLRRLLPAILIVLLYLLYRSTVFSGLGGYRSVNHMHFSHVADVLSQNIAWLLTIPHGHPILFASFLLPALITLFGPPVSRFSLIWLCLFLLPVHNLCNKWYLYTPAAASAMLIAGWTARGMRHRCFIKPITLVCLLAAGACSVLSHAELVFQQKNADVPIRLACAIRAVKPSLEHGTRLRFIMAPPIRLRDLTGHFFDPSTFEVKKVKTPLESIVWDLNATRFTPSGRPVWTRSVEAALQLVYDDISLRAELTDFDHMHLPDPGTINILYDPNTGSLTLLE
ncbi:hypothetical protein JW823_04525 [bacterium]|nr:hypothetical protein [candidate division CSSED10-310 bacterium]